MLTDKFGDKLVLILGLVLIGISYVYIAKECIPQNGYYPSYKYLGIMLIITGMVGESVNSLSGRAIMLWFKDNRRGFAMSIRQTAIPIRAAIGSIIFPYIAATEGFGLAFLVLGILCFLTSLCVLIGLRTKEDLEILEEKSVENKLKSPYRRLLVWKIAIIGGILTVSQMVIMTFWSIYLTDLYAMNMIYISIVIAVIQLGGGTLRVITGIVSDKYKNCLQLMGIIAFIIGISAISLGMLSNESLYVTIILLIVLGLGAKAWHGIGYTEIAEVSGIDYAERALSMMRMVVFFVSFITPYIIPYILKVSSWNMMWIIVGIISLITLVLLKKNKEEII